MPKVEIYTQPWCPYCSSALALLKAKAISFEQINAPHGTAARAEARERSGGRTTVPQIFIDGAAIGGSDDMAALERGGRLDALLGLA